MYVGLSVSLGLAAPVFWILVGHDEDNEDLNTVFLHRDENAIRTEEEPARENPEIGESPDGKSVAKTDR